MGEAGTLTFTVTRKFGYTHSEEVNAEFYAEVNAQTGTLASLAGGKVGGKVSTEISSGYSFQFTSSTTESTEYVAESGSEAYIYQAMVEARTNLGTTLTWGGGMIMTDAPLEFLEEMYLPVMTLLGQGYCADGYYAGWDGKGINSHQSCAHLCLEDADCKFAAFSPGETCSRYRGATCRPNGQIDHV